MTDTAGHLSHFKPAGLRRGRRYTQLEATEQLILTVQARSRWWWPGYRHHEQARMKGREAKQLVQRGVKSGWPDVTLHIPKRFLSTGPDSDLALRNHTVPILAALELKAGKGRPTQAQLDTLHELELCGYRTTVAWGWQEAIVWLDEVAGPQPAVMPEGW